ncbi:MAG: hypothetical protein ACRDV9_01255, partial [Acidimicrobiia bacterium]
MRIFHLCADRGVPANGAKGASVHLRSLRGALERAGHDVVGFAASSESNGSMTPPRWRPFEGLSDLFRAADRLGAPDLVYERYSLGALDGLSAARAFGCPFVLEANAPLFQEAQRHR